MTIIYAVIIFLLLVFIHEFGHFIMAKACNVKVNEFSLGMGPAIWKHQGKETLYSLRCIPLGGYCAMEGEEEDSDDERALNKKNGWQKFIIFVAGALMNALMALLIMILIALFSGMPSTTIGTLEEGMPAASAGIQTGDVILAIDDTEITEWNQVSQCMADAGKEVVVTVDRNGEKLEITVPVMYNKEEQRNMIGITCKVVHNPAKAVSAGAAGTVQMTKDMYRILGQLVTGKVSTSELSGPVGIVTIVGQSSKMGFMYVAYLTALISLNLAVMNLLPFPALDGGRILFLIIRKITGQRVTDEMENRFHFAGMMLLLALMVYVTFNDIGRLLG